ncbi:hypothetical protein ACHBTE_33275 [Streptomyces sp. M41]|uniref:hypothetical protein n=1 Tax=Streptomyces sp. M41 TaxID=3059412 RepID=UPI00374CB1CC
MSSIAYEQLYHLDVASVKAAADQWGDVIRRYEQWGQGFGDGVVKPFDQAGWTSIDGTAVFARAQVAAAEKEFGDAVIEAKGIRAVLEDAYEELRKYKEDLHELAAAAKRNGVRISGTGEVSLIDPEEGGDRRRGPGGVLPSQNEERILQWQARIVLILTAAANADQSAAIALKRNTGKGGDEGFNDKTVKSVDQDESQRASKLLKKYESGEKLSPAELGELDRLMGHNQKDPEFSRMVLDDLGPEGTLRLAQDLEHERSGDGPNKDKYNNIQHALANNIATANKDKEFSDEWRKDMRALGVERTGDDGSQPYGYQTLTTLLKHGDTADYPPRLTTGLTDDIIAAEKKHPDLWNEYDQANAGADVDAVPVMDPVDDMLGIMSRDPDTATAYLDPGDDGGNKRLEYLLNKRDWPDLEVREVYRGQEPTGKIDHIDASNTRVGLGSVLQAATTGEEAGPPHTAGQARIMRDTVELMDTAPGHEEIKPNLRQPLANCLADYTNDTHEILSGVQGSYTHEAPQEHGRGGDGLFGDSNDAHMAPNSDKLIRMMRGISEDPEAYGTMHKAETAYIAKQMEDNGGNTADSVREPVRKGGSALGAYDAVREDVIYDKRDSANAQEDWKAKTIYHVGGTPVTMVPGIGDAAQRMLDAWTYDISNQEKGYNNDAAAAEVADRSLKSQREMQFLVDEWANGPGMPGMDDPSVNDLQFDMRNDHTTGEKLANDAIGR